MLAKELRDRIGASFGARARFDEPMARHTSLRIGGPADVLVRPRDREDLIRLLTLCEEFDAPVVVLGKGFNTLVRDGGIAGVVISLQDLRKVRLDARGHVVAEAGVSHTTISRFCVEHARSGLEFAVGIPGTVGGWLCMNAGTRDREMREVVEAVEWVAPGASVVSSQGASDLRFVYRRLDIAPGTVVVSGTFRTEPATADRVRATMDRYMDARRAAQPVSDLSCGSVFKNPAGDHAGRLIDRAGLKGARSGDAEISPLHANFIVNRGRASARDVLDLIERARREVSKRFDVELEPEVRILGRCA